MLGTLVNVGTVLVGSTMGIMLQKHLPSRTIKFIFQAIGLFTLYLGFSMSLNGQAILAIVFSLILGTATGSWLNLEANIDRVSDRLKRRLKAGNEKFSEGLLTSFLLFCIGSMTILGAIDEGLGNGSELLMTKALMDGFSSMALASAFGVGVTFSVVPLFLFQGGITLLAWWLGSFIPQSMIADLSSVGGIILIGLGINILEIKKMNIMDMLPALLWILPLSWLYGFVESWIR
ncbi:MAG: DUF554 domain-containing protein [Breznakibacter sp.]